MENNDLEQETHKSHPVDLPLRSGVIGAGEAVEIQRPTAASLPCLMALREWGWMAHCRIYGKSRDYGLDMGFVCGAVHFKKGHGLETTFSFTANDMLTVSGGRKGE